MQTFKKKAWEFVSGEIIIGEDGMMFKIVKRERDIQVGIGEFVGLWLVKLASEDDGVYYSKFDPYFEMNGVSLRMPVKTDRDRLNEVRYILDSEDGIEPGVADKLRMILR